MKTALMSLAVVAVAGVAPGIASAATVSVDGDNVIYQAAPKETNSPVLLSSFPTFTWADATAQLTAGPGCVAGPPVSCTGGSGITANLGDRADSAQIDNFIGDTVVDGGDGADDISAGSVGLVTATGGSGADTIRVNANARGRGDGGSGADRMLGTSGADWLTGDDGADLLTNRGIHNSALLDGGDGADDLVGTGGGSLLGGDGSDVLVNDMGGMLDGGGGADYITSQAGGSTITAGAGADVINAADGTGNPDTIDCGSGKDTVYADAGDTVSANCEVRRAGPAPTLPGTAQAISDAGAL